MIFEFIESNPIVPIVVIWLLLYLIWKKVKQNQGRLRIYPLVVIYQSEKFRRFIEQVGVRYCSLWRQLGSAANMAFPILMLASVVYIALNVFAILTGSYVELLGLPIGSRFELVIPFVTVPLGKFLMFILVAFTIAILAHEIFHGAVAVAEGKKIKSAGILISIGVGGGFVELDIEDELRRVLDSHMRKGASRKIKVHEENMEGKSLPDDGGKILLRKFRKIIAAGVFANIILMLLFAVILQGLGALRAYEEHGIKILAIDGNSPAQKYGLQVNDIIIGLAGQRVKTIKDFQRALAGCKPGDNVSITVLRMGSEVTVYVLLAERDGRPYIGILMQQYIKSNIPLISDSVMFDIVYFLLMNSMLELLVFIVNSLPIFFLDGYNWLGSALIERYGKRGFQVLLITSVIILTIFAFNFIV